MLITFTISFHLHSEVIATRHLVGVVCAHIHICLQTNLSSTNPLQTVFCHPNSTYTALSERTHNFHIVETGDTFCIFNSTPPLPLLPLIGLPPASLASSSQSPLMSFFYSPPKVGMPQSSFLSLLFLSISVWTIHILLMLTIDETQTSVSIPTQQVFLLSYKPIDHCLSDILIWVSHWHLNSRNPK